MNIYNYRGIFDPTIEDAEMVELGLSKQVLREELYVPCHPSRGWIRCILSVDNDNGYRLHLHSSKRFLLSAKRFDGDAFLISMHEDFPSSSSRPKRGFVATLLGAADNTFQINLNHCRLCDNKLGFHTCGRGPWQREVVAKISRSTTRSKHSGAESIRSIQVLIPNVTSSDTRAIWCPRCLKIENPDLPMSADVSKSLSLTPQLGDRFVNKSPEWSTEAGCMVVKFEGSSVLFSSSKNFVLIKERKKPPPGDDSIKVKSSPSLIQFGKCGPNKYALDFKYPFSPVQAFGIALTAFVEDMPPISSNSRYASQRERMYHRHDSELTSPSGSEAPTSEYATEMTTGESRTDGMNRNSMGYAAMMANSLVSPRGTVE